MSKSLHEAARNLTGGREGFAEFEEKTAKLWSWWARRLTRDVPAYLDDEDVRQELLIEAWRSSLRWRAAEDPTRRTAEPHVWIAQSAIRAGRKAVMRARGVNRHTWRFNEPSRHDIAIEEIDASVDAEQENALLGEAIVMQVFGQHGPLAALVVQAMTICEGDPESAAMMIYDDRDARLLFRACNEDEVRNTIRTTLEEITRVRAQVQNQEQEEGEYDDEYT